MEARILWLTENYPPQRGGMAQSCDRIVDGLRKNGHLVDVLHFTSRGPAYQAVQQLNGTYTPAVFDESEAHTLNLAWNAVRNTNPAAIACFGGYLPVLAAPVFAKWLQKPLLTLVRGNDFDAAVFTPRRRDLLLDAFRASATVCAVTSEKKNRIEKLCPGVPVAFTPNGIDPATWQATPSEQQFAAAWRAAHCPGKTCIGVFGQLKAKKGVSFFIRSLAGTQAAGQVHLLLAGEVSDEVAGLLGQSEITHTLFPFLDRYELIKYYLCCDAVAIPSYYDGMPNVLLEAGALGIPVLASCVDGMKDVLEGHPGGFLFEPGDIPSCRQALYRFLKTSPEERAALGRKLQATIETEYNHQSESENYENILAGISPAFVRPAVGVQPQ